MVYFDPRYPAFFFSSFACHPEIKHVLLSGKNFPWSNWKADRPTISREYQSRGPAGRYPPGSPLWPLWRAQLCSRAPHSALANEPEVRIASFVISEQGDDKGRPGMGPWLPGDCLFLVIQPFEVSDQRGAEGSGWRGADGGELLVCTSLTLIPI